MKRLQAYKYQLKTNETEERILRRFAGSCRFIFNKALALQQENREAGNKFIGYVAMAKLLTEWRYTPETEWLSEAPIHPLQHTLKDLERAYKNFFAKRADFPRFKKKGQGDSFRYPDSKQFKVDQDNSRIYLPKINRLHIRIANVRKDYLHKTTTTISQNHAIVCIEDLKIKNMSKSANGTVEKPGRNVKAKSGLSIGVEN